MQDKKFINNLIFIATPIILQNLMGAAISMIDTFMLGFVGQSQLSAVSLANQPQFVLSLFFMGINIGTGIIMAQYIGNNDSDAVNNVFFIAVKMSILVSSVFMLLAVAVPQIFMRFFTNDTEMIDIGSDYLRIIGITYLFSGFSQIYLVSLKTKHKTAKSAVISVVALVTNAFLNAVFIFGLLGAPKLEVRGVAIATVIARFIEALLCIIDLCITKSVELPKAKNVLIKKDFSKITIPITLQGFIWGGAMATIAAIMGRMGSDAVAANSVALAIQHIATVVSFGFADGGAILLGNNLGSGELETAKRNSRVLLIVATLTGVICCFIMLLSENLVTSLLNLTPLALQYFSIMYKLLSVNVIFAAITYTVLCGVFPSGGDTKYGLYLDGVVMWGWCVIVGSLGAFVFHLNPIWVFLIINLDEFIKTPLVLLRYSQNNWLKNITILGGCYYDNGRT